MASPIESYLQAFALALALASLCAAGAARAQGVSEADKVLAQSLFEHARQLIEAGQVSAACPKFAESHRLDPAGGTLLNLAFCHEREGKTASAWAEYHEALSLSLKQNRQDREQIAREHLAALEARLTRLSVAPAKGADIEGLEVRLDGVVLRRVAWGTPTAVDPGRHRVEARLPGHEPWALLVTVEGDGQVKRVEVPKLTATPPPAPPTPPEPRYADFDVKKASPWVYVLGVTSAAGLLTASATGVWALVRNTEVGPECLPERHYCTQKGLDTKDSARTLAWVSTLSFGAGVAALVAIPFMPSRVTHKRVRVGAGLGPGRVSLGLGGEF